MKYIQYNLVDPETGIAIRPKSEAPNGRTHPSFKDLNVILQVTYDNRETFVATCDDSVVIKPETDIKELTEDEFNKIIQIEFDTQKADLKGKLYSKALSLTNAITELYHPSEIALAITIKVPEAKLALNATDDETANKLAPYVYSEALVQGKTTRELAKTILEKFDSFKAQATHISGIRSVKIDKVNSVVLDLTNIQSSFSELLINLKKVDLDW